MGRILLRRTQLDRRQTNRRIVQRIPRPLRMPPRRRKILRDRTSERRPHLPSRMRKNGLLHGRNLILDGKPNQLSRKGRKRSIHGNKHNTTGHLELHQYRISRHKHIHTIHDAIPKNMAARCRNLGNRNGNMPLPGTKHFRATHRIQRIHIHRRNHLDGKNTPHPRRMVPSRMERNQIRGSTQSRKHKTRNLVRRRNHLELHHRLPRNKTRNYLPLRRKRTLRKRRNNIPHILTGKQQTTTKPRNTRPKKKNQTKFVQPYIMSCPAKKYHSDKK